MSNSHIEHGLTHRPITKPGASTHTPMVVLIIALIFGMYGLVSHWDNQADLETQIINMQLAHAAQRAVDEQDLAWRISDAYAQGQRDAMAAVKATPTGLALAQACQALLHSDDQVTRQASTQSKPARSPAAPAARTSKGA